MRLDEVLAWWDVFPHEHTEYCISLLSILDRDSEHFSFLWIHRCLPELIWIHLPETLISLDSLRGYPFLDNQFQFLIFIVDIPCLLALGELVERWIRDEYMSIVDEWTKVAEEKCQEECTDMRTIDIRIGHDDDTMIAQSSIVE